MIALDCVTKIFPGKNGRPVSALEGITFDVQREEFVMVTGLSGSGKSTLLFTLGGMMKPTSGKVRLDEKDIYRLSTGKRAELRRSRIGFLFQTFNLIPYLDCLENVMLPAVLAGKPRKECRSKACTLLERMGLRARLAHKPFELSVGERQRAALCRSLVNDPDILLADEPTGNLDSQTTREVMNLLLELNSRGQTIFMVTHDMTLARRPGARSLKLYDGKLVDLLQAEGC